MRIDKRRRLLERDQLDFIVRRGPGLWHHDEGLTRFYYARRNPESLEHYIGAENLHCAILGTAPVEIPS